MRPADEADHEPSSSWWAPDSQELARLSDQGRLAQPLDLRMFGHALAAQPAEALGLDLGCAQGALTVDRFGPLASVSKVVGVDGDPLRVREARRAHKGDARFAFEYLDLEGPALGDELAALIARHGPGRPVIAFAAQLLLHLADPVRLLRALRVTLPSGSVVIVRASDDANKLAYPDADGLAMIVAATARAAGASDRESARKIHHQLYSADFREITMFAELLLLPNMSQEDRRLVFSSEFSYRAGLWRAARSAGEEFDVERLDAALEQLERDLQDPAFFYSSLLYGAVARV